MHGQTHIKFTATEIRGIEWESSRCYETEILFHILNQKMALISIE